MSMTTKIRIVWITLITFICLTTSVAQARSRTLNNSNWLLVYAWEIGGGIDQGSISFLQVARGYKKLHGLGFGAAIFEFANLHDNKHTFASWVTPYVYYPLHSKEKHFDKDDVSLISPILYAFAGVGLLPSLAKSYPSEATDKRYLHAGMSYRWTPWFIPWEFRRYESARIPLTFGGQLGLIAGQYRRGYVIFRISLGGIRALD